MVERQRFEIAVADDVLDVLRRRLAAIRWPDELPESGWDYGTPLATMQDLVAYWRDEFDWRAQELALNTFHHERVVLDGVGIHYVYERGKGPRPLPLILTHGWPSSFQEFVKVIPMLTDPARFGGDPADAFDVVVPSMPGFGFSDRPTARGLRAEHIAGLWVRLMTDVLGYERFGAQGGDIGSSVTNSMARTFPERLVGLHLNSDFAWPKIEPDTALSDQERAFMAAEQQWERDEAGYSHIQGTRPQTLAYGLADSPAGLAAWIVEKYRAWSDCDGDPLNSFTRDELLTNLTIYWATNTIYSACRIYYEHRYSPTPYQPGTRIEVPAGLARFPGEHLPRRPPELLPSRAWVERVYTDLRQWTVMPRGGHFAALEEPELLVEDIRSFFRLVRG